MHRLSARPGASFSIVPIVVVLAVLLSSGEVRAQTRQAPSPQGAPFGGIVAPPGAPSGAQPPLRGPAPDTRATPGPATQAEIVFGLVAPFSGANKDFGRGLSAGVQAAFQSANETGGAGERKLRLVTADDGYEPDRTGPIVRSLVEKEGVAGFICNFGTPTAAAILPYVSEKHVLFFAPFTGSNVVRAVPPDRNVFNFRPSYAEETEAAVRYLVTVRGLRARDIVVFAQDDAFGEAGYAGAAKALRALGAQGAPLRLTYARNTADVTQAIATLKARKTQVRAVVMAAVYRPAARFIEQTRAFAPQMIFTNVSAVGSTALLEELKLSGASLGRGVVVTQVTPDVDGHSRLAEEFRAALARSAPSEPADYVTFEGFIAAKILIEALRRAGAPDSGDRQIDRPGDRIADALEKLGTFDIGLGAPLRFGSDEHQASHIVWGTEIGPDNRYRPIDLR